MEPSTEQPSDKKLALIKWVKRLGIWGFLFFLLKGLVWLYVIYWGYNKI
ncbi:alanyl-tRNA synthetase [Pedobacter sp. MC2016-14]|nr:alanyl-tRNA synthetase [Pedobacter sp. MC2016-14]MCD0489284.1 alanyl-tRNA synthetase [Pedobacter sp. MC2016-14]